MAKGFLWLLILRQISSRNGLHLFASGFQTNKGEHCRLICLQLLFKKKINRDKLSTVKDTRDDGQSKSGAVKGEKTSSVVRAHV